MDGGEGFGDVGISRDSIGGVRSTGSSNSIGNEVRGGRDITRLYFLRGTTNSDLGGGWTLARGMRLEWVGALTQGS